MLVLPGEPTLENEVVCIDLTPLEDGGTTTRTSVASLELWSDIGVRLVKLPSLEEITREYLGGEILSRSIMAKLEGTNYLLCALGDGSLSYFIVISSGTLTDKKKVILETY